jgi:hypothetical protein
MNTLRKQINATFLIVAIALGVTFGSAQRSEATLYESYLPNFTTYYTYWVTTNNNVYLGYAYSNLYYWYASFYSDYYGYQMDSFGYKGDKKLATAYNFSPSTLTSKLTDKTYYTYYYAYYAFYGDYYYHHYVLGDV